MQDEQSIWDVLFDGVPHIVVQSNPVYTLVSNHFRFFRLSIYTCHRLYNVYLTLGEHYWLSCNCIMLASAICTSTWKTGWSHQELPHTSNISVSCMKSDGNDPEVSTLFYLTMRCMLKISWFTEILGAFHGSLSSKHLLHISLLSKGLITISLNDHDTTLCGSLAFVQWM